MDHEDNNAQQLGGSHHYLHGNFDDYAQQHNLLENRNNVVDFAAVDVGAGVVSGNEVEGFGSGSGIGLNIGGKFQEEEADDAEELKYKEVQQSEKQQYAALEKTEAAAAAGGDLNMTGVPKVDYGVDEQLYGEEEAYAHKQQANAALMHSLLNAANFDMQRVAGDGVEELQVGPNKNDGDFSTASNTTSSPTVGEEDEEEEEDYLRRTQFQAQTQQDLVSAEQPLIMHEKHEQADLWQQVEMKIETPQYPSTEENNSPQSIEEVSSLTNTNSSDGQAENYERFDAQQQQEPPQQQPPADSQPLSLAAHEQQPTLDEQQRELFGEDATQPEQPEQPLRPTELNFEPHYILNPEAKEFVPTFSNPASPDKSDLVHFPDTEQQNGVAADEEQTAEQQRSEPALPTCVGVSQQQNQEEQQQQLLDADFQSDDEAAATEAPHPTAKLRQFRLLQDDIVASSPRKGIAANLDAIMLPGENEFEHEAAQRPHEIEQEDALIGNTSASDTANLEAELPPQHDMRASTPESLIDHGPETCVDLDLELDNGDVMKQSIYIDNEQNRSSSSLEQPIEDILNTVQPIPDLESGNDFIENGCSLLNKESLNVEEKEHISQSPSTEEMQMRYHNEYNGSAKDIPALPIDESVARMDDMGQMQESFYVENHFAESAIKSPEIANDVYEQEQVLAENSLLQFERHEQNAELNYEQNNGTPMATERAAHDDLLFADYKNEQQPTELDTEVSAGEEVLLQTEEHVSANKEQKDASNAEFAATPSTTLSTEEKHVYEETREPAAPPANEMESLEQQMGAMLLQDDGNLSQIEKVAEFATTIQDEHNLPLAQDSNEIASTKVEVPEEPPEALNETLQEQSEPAQIVQPADDAGVAATTIAAAAVATAAVAATAAGTKALASKSAGEKKLDAAKKAPIKVAAAKTKTAVTDSKKTAVAETKKTTAPSSRPTTAPSARPRAPISAAASKAATGADKKPPTATASKTTTNTLTARKPVGISSAAVKSTVSSLKTAPKTTTTATKTTTATAKTIGTANAAARTSATAGATRPASSTLAARKPFSTSTSTTATAAAKPRPASAAAANGTEPKPKPKTALSPRPNLTTQLRKAGGTGTTAAAKSPGSIAAAKNPNKPMSPATNGLGGAARGNGTTTGLTNRTKTTSATNTTTSTTVKPFTARPAPKFSTSTLITKRTVAATSTSPAGKETNLKVSHNTTISQRKSSPLKPATTTNGNGRLSLTAPNRIKAKDAVKSPAAKSLAVKSPAAKTNNTVSKNAAELKSAATAVKAEAGAGGDGVTDAAKTNGVQLENGHHGENGLETTQSADLMMGGQEGEGLATA